MDKRAPHNNDSGLITTTHMNVNEFLQVEGKIKSYICIPSMVQFTLIQKQATLSKILRLYVVRP